MGGMIVNYTPTMQKGEVLNHAKLSICKPLSIRIFLIRTFCIYMDKVKVCQLHEYSLPRKSCNSDSPICVVPLLLWIFVC